MHVLSTRGAGVYPEVCPVFFFNKFFTLKNNEYVLKNVLKNNKETESQ